MISITISNSRGTSLPDEDSHLNFSQISRVKFGLSVTSKNLSRKISSVQSSGEKETDLSISCNFLPPFCDGCYHVRIAQARETRCYRHHRMMILSYRAVASDKSFWHPIRIVTSDVSYNRSISWTKISKYTDEVPNAIVEKWNRG